MKACLSFILFIHLYFPAYNQTLKGDVYDEQTKTPIEFASVYFNGSFAGTTTDLDGHFELDISKNKTMPLTISAIGYYSLTLTDFSTGKRLLIYLTPKVYDIKDVVISGKSYARERKKYLRFFINEFIGKTMHSKNCRILNQEDITFNYDHAEDTLKAFALKPLIIDNLALGYKVTYYLDLFEYYTKTKVLFFSGNIIFNEDLIADEMKAEFYLKKRKNVFQGSRMHFFRALWANQLKSNAFKITNTSGQKLIYHEVIFQEGTKKYLSYPEHLDILFDIYYSRIRFLKECVLFDQDGYFDPSGIRWEGEMSRQRIADWLPYEYYYEATHDDPEDRQHHRSNE